MSVPQQIATDPVTRTLTLQWPDGRERQIAHVRLRRACACAGCRRIRLDGGTVQTAPDVTLVDMQAMGYGVQLVFSDGHARGIYPWRYLEELAETEQESASVRNPAPTCQSHPAYYDYAPGYYAAPDVDAGIGFGGYYGGGHGGRGR